MEGGGIQGIENFRKKCKYHKYHPKKILHTKLYLDRAMEKCSKTGGEFRGEGGGIQGGQFQGKN